MQKNITLRQIMYKKPFKCMNISGTSTAHLELQDNMTKPVYIQFTLTKENYSLIREILQKQKCALSTQNNQNIWLNIMLMIRIIQLLLNLQASIVLNYQMIYETKKILGDQTIKVTATTVRVPVLNSHSESINLEFNKPCTREGIIEALRGQKGLIVIDDDANCKYPMPKDATGHDEVYVGRIRIDDTVESGCNIWCVADNIRKGAASNAVQIAEYMIKNNKI